jgi:glycine cleavage system H protein
MSRYYTKSHEWVDFDPERKVARIGVSNYAQQQMGEVIHIEFPSVGKVFEKNDSACVIESAKIAGDIYTPLSGKITAYNNEAEANPSLINDDAERTWLIEITYAQEPQGLPSPEEYQHLVS